MVGGGGFIGRAIVRNLISRGCDVHVLDRNSCPEEFCGKTSWIVGDFLDRSSLDLALHGAKVAYHLISSTVPGDQHVNFAMELHDNVIASLNFIDACVAAGVRRIVFSSSSSVYGVQDILPIGESAPTNPISSHGIHKLAVEKLLLMAQYLHGIEVKVLRIANPYGPGQNIDGRQGFIAMAIGSITRNSPLILRDEGRAVRDFIYIDDLAEAIVLAGLSKSVPQIINLATGVGHSLRDVLWHIEQILGCNISVISAESRRVDIPVSVLDVSLAVSSLPINSMVGLKEGLIKTLRYSGLRKPSNH